MLLRRVVPSVWAGWGRTPPPCCRWWARWRNQWCQRGQKAAATWAGCGSAWSPSDCCSHWLCLGAEGRGWYLSPAEQRRVYQRTAHNTRVWGQRVEVSCTDHGAAEGRVLGQDAGSLGLRSAARPAVGLCALGAQHHPGALVAGHTVPPGQGATMRRTLLLLWVHFLVHSKSSGWITHAHTHARTHARTNTHYELLKKGNDLQLCCLCVSACVCARARRIVSPLASWEYSTPATVQRRNTILFSVSVPVLSEKMYCIWPRSSVMLRALHCRWESVSSSYSSMSWWMKYTWQILTISIDTNREMGISTWRGTQCL